MQLSITTVGQTHSWFWSNDSVINRTAIHFSDYCKNLKSSSEVSKAKMSIDNSLILLTNKLYNSVSTLDEIRKLAKHFPKSRFSVEVKDSLQSFHFIPDANGNLKFYFEGISVNNILVRLRITFGTNTKTGCQDSQECCLQYFDFIYVKDKFLQQIEFPLSLKPFDSEIIIEKTF
jgi:hypothetical protein